MSDAPLVCQDCGISGQYDRVVPFPGGQEINYGVSWRCPQCHNLSLDICPLGPIIPTWNACHNCGLILVDEASDCSGCGLITLKDVESVNHPTSASTSAYQSGLFRQAMRIANRAILDDSHNLSLWGLKHALLVRLGFVQAREQLIRHLLDEEVVSARVWWGMFLHDMHRYSESVTVYREYLKEFPDDVDIPSVRINLANSLCGLAEYSEAETLYQQALRSVPIEPLAYLNYGSLLRGQKRWNEQLVLLQQAFSASGIPPGIVARLREDQCVTLCELNRGPEALAAIEQVSVQSLRTLYLRGRALALNGKLTEALQLIDRVLASDPQHADALRAKEILRSAIDSRNRPWWKFWRSFR